MIDQMLTYLLSHASEILLSLLVALVALGLRLLAKLPGLLEDFGRQLEEQAKKTPGAADDLAAKIVLMVGAALKTAFSKNNLPSK